MCACMCVCVRACLRVCMCGPTVGGELPVGLALGLLTVGGVQEVLVAHVALAAAEEDVGGLLPLHTLAAAGRTGTRSDSYACWVRYCTHRHGSASTRTCARTLRWAFMS